MILVLYVFLFFKQKTAYEMRISDWSSDVCSSDLDRGAVRHGIGERHAKLDEVGPGRRQALHDRQRGLRIGIAGGDEGDQGAAPRHLQRSEAPLDAAARFGLGAHSSTPKRSEEHTSELQSLMRNSYAVFCL